MLTRGTDDRKSSNSSDESSDNSVDDDVAFFQRESKANAREIFHSFTSILHTHTHTVCSIVIGFVIVSYCRRKKRI